MLTVLRVPLLSLLCLIVLATPAAAECAWVLWAKVTPGDWEVNDTHQTEAACKSVIQTRLAQVDPNKRLGGNAWTVEVGGGSRLAMLLCTPDTVDPRGPKGGR